MVGFSRAIDSETMAIGNPLHDMDRMGTLTIGQRKASDMWRNFEKNESNRTKDTDILCYQNIYKQIPWN